jgi:hypothetical protein
MDPAAQGEARTCQNCKAKFPVTSDDHGFYEKMDVPLPTLCPDCRYQRRLMDRNEWSLYRRKCDGTGKSIISIFRPEMPFPVYHQEYWRGDGWDPLQYGRDFDFNRPFFEQYGELRRVTPHMSLVSPNSVNSEYSNQSQNLKDCYMVSAGGSSEKCMYGNWYNGGNYLCGDCYMIEKGELCYECMNCARCYGCAWAEDCFDCSAVHFSIDCHGCQNCFGCVNLRSKNYCWFNEQLDKAESERRLAGFDWSRENIVQTRLKAKELSLKLPRKYFHGTKAYESTGDYLENAQRARLNFNCRESKDTAYLQDSWEIVDCLDNTEILQVERSYEIQGCAYIRNSMAIRSSNTLSDCFYCDMCEASNNCFGCFGVKHKEYCILNKQYPKQEYLALKEKIVAHMKKTGEWGQYFPPEQSPFAYNESVAQDFFPLAEAEARAKGLPWYTPPAKDYKPTLAARDLPPTIAATPDAIVNEVIGCATQESEDEKASHPTCATAFRLIPLEMELYKKIGIPVPEKCFPCRRTDRFAKRNPRRLWTRQCECGGETSGKGGYKNHASHFHGSDPCPNHFETSYAAGRPEIVYCEQCYNAEVV